MLLAAEPAAGIRREDSDAREGQVDGIGDEPLQHVWMLDRAPDRDATAVRRCHEAVRLDREVRGGCGGVPMLDDVIGMRSRHIAPAEPPLGQGVRVAERVVRGTQLRLPDEGRLAVAGRRDREHRRQLLVLDPDEPGGFPRGVEGLGQHGGNRFPVVLGLAAGEERSVGMAGTEAGHRLRQIGRRHDGPHSGHAHRLGRVDRADASAGTVEMDELDVERVVESQVGNVLLCSGDALDPADAPRGAPDGRSWCLAGVLRRARARAGQCLAPAVRRLVGAHSVTVSDVAAATASQIWLYPPHRHRLPDRPSRISAAVTRAWRESSASADMTIPGMQNPHCTPPPARNASWSRLKRAVGAQPFDRGHGPPVHLDGKHETGVDALTVNEHRAGAALSFGAALLRAGQSEVVAKDVEEGAMDGNLEHLGPPIDDRRDDHRISDHGVPPRGAHGRSSALAR